MEGCGVRISRKADGEFLIQEGQFVGDQFLGTFMDCSLSEARQAAAEADFIANQTRPFKAPFLATLPQDMTVWCRMPRSTAKERM